MHARSGYGTTTRKHKSRQLQRKLCLAAKRNIDGQFHALYDRMFWPNQQALAYTWPDLKAMKAVRTRIHDITTRKRLSNPLEEVVHHLKVIRGWRDYFRSGNSTVELQDLDRSVSIKRRGIVAGQRFGRWP